MKNKSSKDIPKEKGQRLWILLPLILLILLALVSLGSRIAILL